MGLPISSSGGAPAAPATRRKRQKVAIPWGNPRFPFQLAPITERDVKIGWGATCYRHRNADDDAKSPHCKKQITFGVEGLTDEACIRRLKLWLLAGFAIGIDSRTGRRDHVKIDARIMTDELTDAELDARLALQ